MDGIKRRYSLGRGVSSRQEGNLTEQQPQLIITFWNQRWTEALSEEETFRRQEANPDRSSSSRDERQRIGSKESRGWLHDSSHA